MTTPSWGIFAKLLVRTAKEATLKLENGEVIHWPLVDFPPSVMTGEKVHLVVETEALYHQERTALAKAVLNELLQGSH